MTAAELAKLLVDVGEYRPLILVGIFLASFVIEDAATIAAALLSAHGLVDPSLAIAVLCVGTAAGDIGLHLAGRLARRNPWVERQCARPAIAHAADRLFCRRWPMLFAARFVPGLRLPAYLASGLIQLPTARCGLVIALATVLWTPSLFLLSMRGWTILATVKFLPGLAVLVAALLTLIASWRRRRLPKLN